MEITRRAQGGETVKRTMVGCSPETHSNNSITMGDAMKRILAAVLSVAMLFAFTPVTDAAPCPPEVGHAKDLLGKKAAVKDPDVQAPRSLAGARQDIQA